MASHLNLRRLFQRAIVVQKCFIDIVEDLNAALMLTQAFYWLERLEDIRDGWFYKTADEWKVETTLSRRQQERARAILRKFDFWNEDLRGVPAKMWYRVDEERLEKAILALDREDSVSPKSETQFPPKGETSFDKKSKPVARKKENIHTKITSEITSKRDNGLVGKGNVENSDSQTKELSEAERKSLMERGLI